MIRVSDSSLSKQKASIAMSALHCIAEDLSLTAAILTSIGIHQPSYDDCYIIREVCKTISLRAAKLAAAGTVES